MTDTKSRSLDPTRFREVLGHYPTGVTAVTGIADDGEPCAMVVGTFTSVSLEPPLVAFMPTRTSFTFDKLRTAESLAINILAHDQEQLCRRLAKPQADKLKNEAWELSKGGAPILADIVASIDCKIEQVVEGGDHYIVLCAVEDLNVHRSIAPLVFFQGGYGGFAMGSFMIRADQDLAPTIARAQTLRSEIESLAFEIGGEITLFTRQGDDAVAVLSAVGADTDIISPLGSHYPLIPPLGDAFIAWSAPEEQQRWISKAFGATEQELLTLRQRLAEAHERGWSLSLDAPGRRDQLEAAIGEYGAGDQLPAKQREISQRIVKSAGYFPIGELDQTASHDVATITVPIHLREGEPQLILRLLYPPKGVPGTTVEAWAQRILSFAADAARLLE
ncbi:flavin reductase [Arthrobacter sp. StoSoilB5]|uniref:flavin reductase family protein n=1 Tax=Arthrobacter sp. StoSoilB5 TaxID=2830992 RepID=UPI001CC479F5|nr:flavin reductase [Arthrobacter sp. StoSoilB5]BCW44921.1 flavin reductase [Arthrobacter sp. StoSoilB5]